MTGTTVGRAVLETVRAYGIDTIFGIPGTHNVELYRHLGDLGIRAVTNRHEQGAGYGADGWAQQRGLPGVVLTTSGPGLLNALSAVATAYCESRPLIVISPGPALGTEGADVGTLHETKDTSGAADAVAAWSRRVRSGTEAVTAIHDAFTLARTGRPRPVHVEIPLDVLEGPSDAPESLVTALPRPTPAPADPAAVVRAADLLRTAARPVVLAGGGSLPAGQALTALAERLQAPVVTTLNGKAAIPESHPLSLGSNLRFGAARAVCEDADVLLVIGSKVGEAELWVSDWAPRATVVRVDVVERQLTTNLAADIGLHGDSAAVVEQLLAALDGHVAAAPPALDEVRAAMAAELAAAAPAVVETARRILAGVPDDAIVAGDSSQIIYLAVANLLRQDRPHSLLYMPTYATLGYGLPAAIGARVAAPDRPVVAVLGDGALMFSVQELATAVEQGLDLTIVCVDNGGYAEIRQNQLDAGAQPVGVDLVQPDWAALATAFGGAGERVDDPAAVTDAVAKAVAAGGVRLVHLTGSAAA